MPWEETTPIAETSTIPGEFLMKEPQDP
jgi:hypothetical protein